MENGSKPTTILDVSKALGYDLLYHPVIGSKPQSHYPLVIRPPFRRPRRPKVYRS